MKTIRNGLFIAGFLMGAILPLQGCNLANSADSVSNGSDEPSASLSIKSALPAANTDGSFEESTELTLVASGSGSRNSGIDSCDLSLFKLGTDDVFGTTAISSITGCGETTMVAPTTGIYKLVLTVTDENAKTAKTEKSIKVASSILNAEFSATQATGLMQINLDASTSTKGQGGSIVSYTWQVRLKIDDSSTADVSTQTNSSPETKVVVNSDGIYVIQLTVTDAGSNTDVEQQQVAISSTDPLVPEFTLNSPTGFVAEDNLEVSIDTTEAANIDHVNCYLWLYDGTALSETPISESYAELSVAHPTCTLPVYEAGVYTVEVEAINSEGNEHSRYKVIQYN